MIPILTILLATKPGGLNAAIYTQITDVENECDGLMTYDRLVKPDMARIFNSNQKAISGELNVTAVVPTSQTVPQTWHIPPPTRRRRIGMPQISMTPAGAPAWAASARSIRA